MSSSVLQNVIHPKAQTRPLGEMDQEKGGLRPLGGSSASLLAGAATFEAGGSEPEDLELVLGALVENAPVAMAMFDRGMRYMLANRQWIKEFGLQQVQPLVGRSQYEVFPGLHPGWRQVYDRALQGHVVRSEHDALCGPDGRAWVYRWEVRPWRKKRDATVGGLMVTCEKFSPNHSGESDENPPDGDAADGPVAETRAAPPECAQPVLLVNAEGVILSANAAAARLTLERGLQEGTTSFWEMFGERRDFAALRQETLAVLAQCAADDAGAPAFITTRVGSQDDVGTPSCWMVTPVLRKDRAPHFMLIAQPMPPQAEAPAPPPPVMATVMPPPPIAPPAADDAAMRRMEEELLRARQELRTLAEAQHAFGRREERLRTYLEAVPCGVFVLDERGAPLFQNERLARLLGRPLEKGQTMEEWLAHACPTEEHREQVVLVWRESVWRRQLTRVLSLATEDGLLKELEFNPMSLPDGGLLVSIQDVTEHTRHEEQLRSMEARLRMLLTGSPVAVVLTDKTGVIFEVNQQAEALLGQSKAELRRYPLDAWLEPGSAAARRDALRNLKHGGRQAEALGVRVKHASGGFSDAILHMATVADAQGEPHCTIHYLQEAGQPKSATAAAHVFAAAPMPVDASMRQHTPEESAPALLLSSDANGRVRVWTEHARRIFDLEAAEITGRPLHQLFRPSDATGFFADLCQQAGDPEQFVERPFFGGKGRRGQVLLSAKMLEDGGFELRARAEPQAAARRAAVPAVPAPVLQAAVPLAYQVVSPSSQRWPIVDLEREKLLLTETHHRIKNHLQIISSLLNMQINGVSDQIAREALRSSQNRVRAIAALHQHLYQIALGRGDTFSDFTRDLVSHLRQCYEAAADQIAVRLEIQEGPVQPEWLMPLALTLNEALSNAFEHAFPHGRKGQINAALSYSQASGELVISDDGIGLPSGFNPGESGGLGLKILAVFAEQMRGQLFVQGTPEQGAEVRLRFPLFSHEA